MIGWMQRRVSALNRAPIESGFILGAIGAAGLIIAMFVTGSTFGQRCAKLTQKGSPEWQQCVQDLSQGKKEKD